MQIDGIMWALEACYLFGIWPRAGFGRNLWSHHPDATLAEEGGCLVRRRTCGIPTVRKYCYRWRINKRAAVMVVAEGVASMVLTGMMQPPFPLVLWCEVVRQALTSQEKCVLVLWHSSAADEALHPCMLFVVLCITVLAFRVGRSGGKFSFGQGFSVYGSMIFRMVARRVINWGVGMLQGGMPYSIHRVPLFCKALASSFEFCSISFVPLQYVDCWRPKS